MAHAKPKRRFLRFRMRTVLLAMTVLCFLLAWIALKADRARKQRRVVDWVRQLGGQVTYDTDDDDVPDPFGSGPFAKDEGWLRENFGVDFFDNVVAVTLEGEDFADISKLAALRDVRDLCLTGTSVSNLSVLAGMSHLDSLTIYGSSVYNWDESQMEYARSPVKDLSPLSATTRLRRLTLNVTSVSDLTPVAKMTNLQELSLIDSPVSDISPLAGLTSLQLLDLRGTSVSDLSPLAGMQRLQRLDLQQTTVTELSPLAGMTRLKWLNLNAVSSVKDLKGLTRLTKLGHLDLS
ncbi:MAG: hypothetical protein IH991_16790, partial [Planctomycetes bacterium]|nr:hypothetical protein [Planctomycetota bacterium]